MNNHRKMVRTYTDVFLIGKLNPNDFRQVKFATIVERTLIPSVERLWARERTSSLTPRQWNKVKFIMYTAGTHEFTAKVSAKPDKKLPVKIADPNIHKLIQLLEEE